MNKDFIRSLDELEREKGINKQDIIDAIEKALIKSYEEQYGESNVEIDFNKDNGDIKVYSIKDIVEEVENKETQISLEEALSHRKRSKLGGQIKIQVKPKDFLRVAAQKGKNIVIQFLRDAERRSIYDSYIDKEKELLNGSVQRIDHNNIYVDLGKSEGFIPERETVEGENFKPGDRIKVYVKEVKDTPKGPQIILSRKDGAFVTRLFELEVPEISQGLVDVMSIAREAGFRTKIAVRATDENIDPVGATVGMKGSRVNAIVEEINGEKIDIIIWDEDIKVYISNSLSPAEVVYVFADEKSKEATAFVPDSQLSLAIGKEGQNVRLAAKLTGWKIDIKPESQQDEIIEQLEEQYKEAAESEEDENIENNDALDISIDEEVLEDEDMAEKSEDDNQIDEETDSIRVYELAKEVGLSSKELIESLKKNLSINVKSHMSSLEGEELQKALEYFDIN
ncbi:transcription termination factor NusA [uncultured Helcococcus sp.]|uniref:transcription termination factor NusA n=1 Tax=uncultured Helcococcus sp. TaxID=1072508 RepID=UPI002889EFF1|nr:transcription termination factor NusA [uncultured Helcococcus sp.]